MPEKDKNHNQSLDLVSQFREQFFDIDSAIQADCLWQGKYKIPWDAPDFSQRMLKEHLSQEHDLASRKQEIIRKQTDWIQENVCNKKEMKILDLGCGPGFYLNALASNKHRCYGIDFSPASIKYAQENAIDNTQFTQGDIRLVEFGQGYDMAMMIFGELNVFSPDECKSILRKVYNSLNRGAKLIIEVHTFDTVKNAGTAPNSWYKSESGLFSPYPHLCLINNHWFEEEKTTLQCFYVIDLDKGDIEQHRNTIKAWENNEYHQLLAEAGFEDINIAEDWPCHSDDLFLLTATKP